MKNRKPCYCKDCQRQVPAGHGELKMGEATPWVNRGGYTVYTPGQWYVTCKETATVEAKEAAR